MFLWRGSMTALIFINFVSSCFINNCPRGGKRNHGLVHSSREAQLLRSCTNCGPEMTGVCISKNICCGSQFGCLMGTPHTVGCQQFEVNNQEACLSLYTDCGDDGQCVAPGVCCSKDCCKMDRTCIVVPNQKGTDIISLSQVEPWNRLFIQTRIKDSVNWDPDYVHVERGGDRDITKV